MATDLRSLPAFLADDATFRTWGSGIAAQLTAVGLVQAADTGQINWTTVARPGAINTTAGFEIWRFNDSLQATKPVFIKLEYGVAGALDRPRVAVSVSTATNGTGTLTGQVSSVRTIGPTASKSTGNTLPSYCAGSTSRLNLAMNLDTVSATFGLATLIERTKTAAGVDTGDGIAVVTFGASPGYAFQLVPFAGSIASATASNPALDLNAGGSTVSGSDVLIAPAVLFYGKALFGSWCAYKTTDPGISALTSITVDHLGATRTYMPLGAGLGVSAWTLAGAASTSLATLWE